VGRLAKHHPNVYAGLTFILAVVLFLLSYGGYAVLLELIFRNMVRGIIFSSHA